jgi:NAD(P)-dependent dehydrogenase (short-subunit alcohol dehydrogenase family)
VSGTTCSDGHPLQNKHVAVVGGSSGVGLAIAALSFSAGARVTLLARELGKLRSAAQQVGQADVRSIDLRRPETIAPAVGDLGVVDHLVVTAGTFRPARIATSDPADWRGILEERVIGALSLIKLLAPRLTSSIVFFSGAISRKPVVGCTVLAAAAAAIEGAMRGLALELAPIRVNAVAPGMLDTPMLDELLAADKTRVCAGVAQKLPVGRIGTAHDAAGAALFLMTNPYMSGATLEIDGGSHLI